jgi:hypothetical protein
MDDTTATEPRTAAPDFGAEIARLRAMTVGELRVRYGEVFGHQPRSRNKDYLWKRVAYRIQELAEGGLSERARRRAEELACDAELRTRPRRPIEAPLPASPRPERDPRLPIAGAVLRRTWAGREHVIEVLEKGFVHEGRRFDSLSAVARAIAGTRWNGFLFFGLTKHAKETRR